MKKINISYEDLKEIFLMCNLVTLDSLDILLENVNDYDLTKLNSAFNSAYQKIWDKNKDQFQGINEYDYLTKLHNFGIKEMIELIDDGNQNELNGFKNLITSAIKNINEKKGAELEILPKLEESLNMINMSLNSLSSMFYALNGDELENLFNKYNILELKSFDIIFKYIYLFDIEHIRKIKDEVQNRKQQESFNIVEEKLDINDFRLLDLACKNDSLDKKELNFLEELLYEANENIKHLGFNNCSLQCVDISHLHELLIEEIKRRKVKTYNINR